MQGDVVAHYLVEYRLVNRNVRSLVFHDDHRFAILAENHRVAPFACPVDIDTDFVGHQRLEYCEGPSLVIAGAGSGKTRVLTYKVVHLLRHGLSPDRRIVRYFRYEMVCAGVVVYYAAIMVYAVGNHKVVGMQGDVVAHYLVDPDYNGAYAPYK